MPNKQLVLVGASFARPGVIQFFETPELKAHVPIDEFRLVQPQICWVPPKFYEDIYRYSMYTWNWSIRDWELMLSVYGV